MKFDLNKLTNVIGFLNSNKVLPEKSEKETQEIATRSSNSKEAELEYNLKELHSWTTTLVKNSLPSRIKSSILVIGSLLVVFSIITGDFIFVMLILSLVFLYNVLNSSNQNQLSYKIYNTGVDYLGTYYRWDQLRLYFFFPDKDAFGLDTVELVPGRLYFYYNKEDKEKLEEILNLYLKRVNKPPQNYVDMIVDKIKPKLNLKD
jgi:hypothetical protein